MVKDIENNMWDAYRQVRTCAHRVGSADDWEQVPPNTSHYVFLMNLRCLMENLMMNLMKNLMTGSMFQWMRWKVKTYVLWPQWALMSAIIPDGAE